MAIVESNLPLPEVKRTRQWDAWTREEEDNFFNALRQFGKNFEKITSRVQSKNKDQVRHYYYRVIKRMNRILDPTLVLDAKNPTYVNSAMLRWWSLLEKHSCSASKLRLKPRRFKTFVTALEHQLIKEHKRAKTKKPTPAAFTSRKLACNAGTNAVIPLRLPELVGSGSGVGQVFSDDLANPQGVGSGQRGAVKRKAAVKGSHKSIFKGEAKHPSRSRKKTTDGNLLRDAFTKVEKAARLGVLAEAAEQIEQSSGAMLILPSCEVLEICGTSPTGGHLMNVDVEADRSPACISSAFSKSGLADNVDFPNDLPADTRGLSGVVVSSGMRESAFSMQTMAISSAIPIPSLSSKGELRTSCEGVHGGLVIFPELCSQVKAKSLTLDATRCNNCSTLRCNPEEGKIEVSSAKLRLQLFPFDEFIRKALEQDGHNPHLELTFKAQKSIFSVLHHLAQKWGRSTIATGELRLFPFNTQWSNLSACQSWSFQDPNVSAADVHAALGNPTVFRLRYAWLASCVQQSSVAVLQEKQALSSSMATGKGAHLLKGSFYSFNQHCSTPPQAPILPYGDLSQRTSVHPCQSGCPLVEKLSQSNELPSVHVEIYREKSSLSTGPDGVPVSDGDSKDVDKSDGKEPENTSQASGCAWLYESNDGFAQQLWSYEDTLRTSNGVTIAQMDWVDSLTNLSVTELLGEGSRSILDCSQHWAGLTQLTCLEPSDIETAGQEMPLAGPVFVPIGHPTIWGGEETCDGFSFQRQDRCSKEVIMSSGDGAPARSLGFDVPFSYLMEGGSARFLGDLDVEQQQQKFQSEDLLFGGDSTMGLGYLIGALAQGSLDEFQAWSINRHREVEGTNQETRQIHEDYTESKVGNADAFTGLPIIDREGQAPFGYLWEDSTNVDLSNGNCELIEMYERLSETVLPNVSIASPDLETLKKHYDLVTRDCRGRKSCTHLEDPSSCLVNLVL